MPIMLNIPVILKINSQVSINLDHVASMSVDYGLEQNTDKEDPKKIEKFDTVSFFFIVPETRAGAGLSFRRGIEVDDNDFYRIVTTIKRLGYKLKDDRKPSTTETPKGTK